MRLRPGSWLAIGLGCVAGVLLACLPAPAGADEAAAAAPGTPDATGPAPSPAAGEMLKAMREKGILSEEEYESLYRRQARYEAEEREKQALPGWMKDWTVGGDLRLRYDRQEFGSGGPIREGELLTVGQGTNIDGGRPDLPDPRRSPRASERRERYQFRLRLGAEKLLGENFTVGFRLASAQGTSYGNGAFAGRDGLFAKTVNADPRSENVTLGDYFSGKGIWIDRAYLRFNPSFAKSFKLTAGKIPNPFLGGDNPAEAIVWDPDIQPEGMAAQYRFDWVPETFWTTASAGYFLLDEVPSATVAVPDAVSGATLTVAPNYDERDPYMWGAQVGFTLQPDETMRFNAKLSYYALRRLNTGFIAATNDLGNTGTAADGNPLLVLLSPSDAFFQSGRSRGKIDQLVADTHYELTPFGDARFRVKPFFLWSQILTAASQDDAWGLGLELGSLDFLKLTVMYSKVKRDGTVALFTDSDLFDGQTNAKGWYFAAERRLWRSMRLRGALFKSRQTQGVCAVGLKEPALCDTGLTNAQSLVDEFRKTSKDRIRAQVDVMVDF